MSLGPGHVERGVLRGLGKLGMATGPELCRAVFKLRRGERGPTKAALSSVRRALRSLHRKGRSWPVYRDGQPRQWLRRKRVKHVAPLRGQLPFELHDGGVRQPLGGVAGDIAWPSKRAPTRRVDDERQLRIALRGGAGEKHPPRWSPCEYPVDVTTGMVRRPPHDRMVKAAAAITARALFLLAWLLFVLRPRP